MKHCPTCKRDLKEQLSFCPYDGAVLAEKPEKTDSLIGIMLDDKYRLDQMIGQGGMGTVYKAIHIEMENTVAVKVLHPHLASDRLAVERFRREARAAAQIRHPNAVAVTDFGVTRDEEVAYLVMEFLEGEDLRDRIRQSAQMDIKETSDILEQICSAVHAAHIKGIIHRDLKPDNIWILNTEDLKDRVKVLDFGIAKLKVSAEGNTLTQKGMIVGTPYYMSPEQCRGEELDAGSDIYSLGVILYEMLTGRVPFEGSTPLAVVLKHNNEEPRPLRAWRAEIPEQVEEVVLRALSKNRNDRQDSALDLAAEFERAASGITQPMISQDTGDDSRPTVAVKSYQPEAKNQPPVASTTRAYDPKFGLKQDPAARSADEAVTVRTPSLGPSAAPSPAVAASASAQPDSVAVNPKRSKFRSLRNRMKIESLKRSSSQARIISAAILVAIIGVVVWLMLSRTAPIVKQEGDSGEQTKPAATPVPEGMAFIKGGTFIMGTNDDAPPEWRPEHPVTVQDFYLDINEVTNEEYFRFVKQMGHPAPPHWVDGNFPPGESKLPVYNVSWYDAKAYAEWAGKRLPREDEWEYAARGAGPGTTPGPAYPWGDEWSDDLSNSGEIVRIGRRVVPSRNLSPVAVGSYPRGKSRFGIADMAGNVAEWVEDDFSLYPGSTAKPAPGFKFYRGGAYRNYKRDSKTFVRWYDLADTKVNYVGFRCAKDVSK